MPIKGLTDQPRAFVELGQLRKGAPKPKNEPRPGGDLTYFRATFNEGEEEAAKTFYAEYGNEPGAIEIFLPFDEPGLNFETWKEAYLASGLIHRCDGEYIQYAVDYQSGEVLVQNGIDANGNPVECNGEPVAYWIDKQGKEQPVYCKPEGRLKIIVPALRRLAYMTVLTHSIWDIVNLSSQLEGYWWENNQKLRGIRFVLKRRPKMISTPSGTGGKRARRKKWLLHIEPAPSWVEEQLLMLEEAARPRLFPVLELPPGVPDTNGDIEIEEVTVFEEEMKSDKTRAPSPKETKQEVPIGPQIQVPRNMNELYMMAGKPPHNKSKDDAVNKLTVILSEEIGPGTSIKNALDEGITVEELWEKLIAKCSSKVEDKADSDPIKVWHGFLESVNITQEEALKILNDAKSVNEWVKEEKGRSLDTAIEVIREELDWQAFLNDYNITIIHAEKMLGNSLEEWRHLNPTKTTQDAIDEIVAVGGLTKQTE